MTREKRNKNIQRLKEVNNSDRRAMYSISAIIGDDEEIELDWLDLEEATGLELDEIEEVLSYMYDLEIIKILDFENSLIG